MKKIFYFMIICSFQLWSHQAPAVIEKEKSISHHILGFGPMYSDPSTPDFVIEAGILGKKSWKYDSLEAYSGCVLKTSPLISFGSPDSKKVRLDIRLRAKIEWQGPWWILEKYHAFKVFVSYDVHPPNNQSERHYKSLPLYFHYLPEIKQETDVSDIYSASTKGLFQWFNFERIETNGEISQVTVEICNLPPKMDLWISEIEFGLSHDV